MNSAAYKFANQVMPLMLGDIAQGRAPDNYNQPTEKYSPPNAVAPLPQGPTATNVSAIPPQGRIEPHELGAPVQKSATFEEQLVQLAVSKLHEKEAANWLGAAANFGRGALSIAKPVIGAVGGTLSGGARGAMSRGFGGAVAGAGKGFVSGAGKGINAAAKTIYKGGPAAAAGALAAGYGVSQISRNPIVMDGEGFRVRSPVRVPDVRLRSPITMGRGAIGSGFRVQTPWKTLW